MKKYFYFVLPLLFCFCLASCGQKEIDVKLNDRTFYANTAVFLLVNNGETDLHKVQIIINEKYYDNSINILHYDESLYIHTKSAVDKNGNYFNLHNEKLETITIKSKEGSKTFTFNKPL